MTGSNDYFSCSFHPDCANMSAKEESLLELDTDLADRPLWLAIAETAISLVILMTAFFGNLLVCWAVYRINILRQPRNYFIILLALSDVCMASLVMPFSFGVFARGRWSYGFAACQFQGVLCVVFGSVSLQTVTLTAVNRCMKMTRPPAQYQRMLNKNSITFMLLMSWLMAWSIPISNFLVGGNFKFHPGKTFCYEDFNYTPKWYSKVMFNGFFNFSFRYHDVLLHQSLQNRKISLKPKNGSLLRGKVKSIY